jgi:hypothetical protein
LGTVCARTPIQSFAHAFRGLELGARREFLLRDGALFRFDRDD